MIIGANFLIAAARVLDFVLDMYFYIVIGSAIISWVNADPWNPIVKFLRSATEPVYRRIRKAFPFLSAGGIDFTPMAVIGIIIFLQTFLVGTLMGYARSL